MGKESDKQPTEALELLDVTLQDADLMVTIQEPYAPAFEDGNNPENELSVFCPKTQPREEPFYITALHPNIDRAVWFIMLY